MATYYDDLGVTKTATTAEIKKAFKTLASKHHPDHGGDAEKFKTISIAYDVLRNPQKRAKYNESLHYNSTQTQFTTEDFNFSKHPGKHTVNINDLMSNFRSQCKNKDIQIAVELTLEETLFDQVKMINIKTTTDTVAIKIPRGTTNNSTIKYHGLGDDFLTQLPRGDLIVQFKIKPHPKFIVDGANIIYVANIDCFSAILGTTIEIPGLDSKTFLLNVPPGSQQLTRLRIRDQGLYKNQTSRGNLLVALNITIPKLSDSESTEMLQKLQEIIASRKI